MSIIENLLNTYLNRNKGVKNKFSSKPVIDWGTKALI